MFSLKFCKTRGFVPNTLFLKGFDYLGIYIYICVCVPLLCASALNPCTCGRETCVNPKKELGSYKVTKETVFSPKQSRLSVLFWPL